MKRTKTVIIGAGFGGLEAAKRLAKTNTDIILIDKTNHHLFQPLLYQVATAALSPVDIAVPVRLILRDQKNVTFLMGTVDAINKENKTITLENGATIDFDYLIVATGARHSYFGHDEWEKTAPGLKTLQDAALLREKILKAFERAERAATPEEARSELSFAVIGGGPTGVELAGAIAEIAFKTVIHDFRNIDSKQTEIYLVEAASQLLPGFPQQTAEEAKKDLEELGVHVVLNFLVTDVTNRCITSNQRSIPVANIIWAAGNQASPLLQTLDIPLDRQKRAIVTSDLSIPGHPHIFVIGDAACALDPKGKPYPALAPVAKQQGRYVAQTIASAITNPSDTLKNKKPFHYVDKGSLATIGKGRAVGLIGSLQVKGFIAWFIWSIIHIFYLIGFRNRLFVLSQWGFWYIRGKRRVQLITTPIESEETTDNTH